MPPRPEMALREVQQGFAAALRDASTATVARVVRIAGIVGHDSVDAAARLGVYGNNARHFFATALERTYPVLRHRTGNAYFSQLAHEYRAEHPSTHGDLHWIGEAFPGWLGRRLQGTDYEWLADLARLEWACESSWGAAHAESLGPAALGRFRPDRLDDLIFDLQPSTHLVNSAYPVWSVWHANQGDAPGESVDLGSGGEHCVVTCGEDRVAIYRVAQDDFALLEHLVRGATLGFGLAAVDYELANLPPLLTWLFAERFVTGLRLAE